MYDMIETFRSTSFNFDFVSNGLSILVYILQALALYTIAKRRGIRKPWLAWIPFGNSWILGSLSDQYRYVTKREIKNKRKSLLGLEIAMSVLVIAVVVAASILLFTVLFGAGGMMAGWLEAANTGDFSTVLNSVQNMELTESLIVVAILLLGAAVALIPIAIAYLIVFWMAIYDLFRSCEPDKSTTYLVISLVGDFVVSGLYSVFMILCKDKDLGMPPRKPEPEELYAPEQVEE